MAWFVAQVWVLCALAFLLGAGVTWLLFVRPPRPGTARAGVPAVTAPPAAPPGQVAEEPAAAPALPALAALDTPPLGVPRGTGARAAGALDLLGVTPAGAAPTIPAQPGPPDEDAPRP